MKIKVSIDSALKVLNKNLAEHVTELKEANKGWTKKTIKALEVLRDAVDKKGLEASHHGLNMLFVQKPKDNRKDYSRFIGALEVSKKSGQTHVELDELDYDRMFNDNWDWRMTGKSINTMYRR